MAIKFVVPALLAIAPLSGQGAETGATFPIPQSLVAEHQALHAVLGNCIGQVVVSFGEAKVHVRE